ncbi:MAG: nuclear transport factor 2 family protein [Erythrobacter sp.]|uniref:nuclear transport factor 2 family protein n=1 Tax=Erythrobacter sp. TaxID=1042 RepID=UPI0025CD2B85|nr:nuclear transport factor 2 family protein [Erythrobacter sp.]MCL9998947.1 nuclear transport factor 2 family protein [Erythrobacter sp.]
MDLTELADRLAIAETLALYCRGIDRCDPEQLAAAFTSDALIDYGDGARPIAEVIPGLMAGLGSMRQTQHNISNTVMRIAGDTARAETNCVALHIIPAPEGEIELVVGGRYLDTLHRREGRWLIAERLYVMDWNRTAPATMALSGGLFDGLQRRGARGSADPAAAWWAKG